MKTLSKVALKDVQITEIDQEISLLFTSQSELYTTKKSEETMLLKYMDEEDIFQQDQGSFRILGKVLMSDCVMKMTDTGNIYTFSIDDGIRNIEVECDESLVKNVISSDPLFYFAGFRLVDVN